MIFLVLQIIVIVVLLKNKVMNEVTLKLETINLESLFSCTFAQDEGLAHAEPLFSKIQRTSPARTPFRIPLQLLRHPGATDHRICGRSG